MTVCLNGIVKLNTLFALSTLTLVTAPQRAGADPQQDAEALAPAAEHHLHIRSADAAAIVKEMERPQAEPRPAATKE